MTIYLDSFSGAAADLKAKKRTHENVLAALKSDPRISVWDMQDHYRWLQPILNDLVRDGSIVEDKSEPYPWLRYVVNTQPRGDEPA